LQNAEIKQVNHVENLLKLTNIIKFSKSIVNSQFMLTKEVI